MNQQDYEERIKAVLDRAASDKKLPREGYRALLGEVQSECSAREDALDCDGEGGD